MLVLALAAGPASAAEGGGLTVFAASDLAFALREIVPAFERAAGVEATLVLGSTGNLAQQIEHGAPADVFFAADESFVDALVARRVLLEDTRTVYARGVLVLATARRARERLTALRQLLDADIRRVAIANPAHAPYGRAAQQALQGAGLWGALQPKLVYAENVRQALQYLQTGAVEAGIVARSIATVPDIAWVPIDPALHAPLDQAAAVVGRSGQQALGRAFIAFVTGSEGRAIMKRHGFLLPGEF